jgi:GTPase involved in cell partitioning and DNA repair
VGGGGGGEGGEGGAVVELVRLLCNFLPNKLKEAIKSSN